MMSDNCAICKSSEPLQEHHISYVPEITIDICRKCHLTLHGKTIGGSRKDIDNPKHGIQIMFRVPQELLKIMKTHTKIGPYINLSEFIRESIRSQIISDTSQPLIGKSAIIN